MNRFALILDAFLDGFTGAGLFGKLRRPGAPDVLTGPVNPIALRQMIGEANGRPRPVSKPIARPA